MQQNEIKTIKIDDVEYVRADLVSGYEDADKLDDMDYVIVRGDKSGVFAGYLGEQNGRELILHQCIRLWYWDGAASISQIAMDGVSKPKNCKFAKPVKRMKILDAIEILNATKTAQKSICAVSPWQM